MATTTAAWTGGIAAALLLSVTTALTTTTAGATASASRVVLHDGTGDVWRVNMRTSHWTKVGELAAADVTRAAVRHRPRAVVVRLQFVDLRRVGVQTYWAGIDTPDDDFFAELVSRRGSRAGRLHLYDGPAGTRITCTALAHHIDYVDDVVSMRVPRSCLGRPRWVTANLGNILVLGQKPDRRHYADNPHDDGPYMNVGTGRIYRG